MMTDDAWFGSDVEAAGLAELEEEDDDDEETPAPDDDMADEACKWALELGKMPVDPLALLLLIMTDAPLPSVFGDAGLAVDIEGTARLP